MKSKIQKKFIIYVLLIIVLFFLINLFKEQIYNIYNSNNKTEELVSDIKKDASTEDILIDIKVGENVLKYEAKDGDTLFDILNKAKQEGKISFSGKEYANLGFFMTQIGDLNSNDKQYLLYYINGEEASLGISSYKPKNGDLVEWKLKDI